MDARLAPVTDELLARASACSGEKVLDIGCGSGATTVPLAEAVGPNGLVTGIDISETMLAAARERCRGLAQVSLENTDAQMHPFPEGSYDLLASRFGVMFFGDPYAAFENLLRALRPQGRLHFVCWAPVGQNPWFTVPLEVAKRHLGAPEPKPPRAPGPLAFSEAEYVQDILARAGFANIRIDPFRTAMESSETLEQQAKLFLKLGPAARLIAEREPDAETLQTLTSDLITELAGYKTGDQVSLRATVYYVSGER
jgi:ubiquinone/menaquinone biosynthesis C-methylase UbiE